MSEGPDPTGQHRRSTDLPESDSVAEVFNRFTLDSGRRGWRRKRAQKDPGPQEAKPEPTPSEPASPAGPPSSNAPGMEAPWPPTDGPGAPAPSRESGSPSARDASPAGETMSTSIRPYAWTGGRTRSNHHLELETLVSASEFCTPERLRRTEHHSISEICQHPRSIAEVGAMLGVPFGVAKVLVGDMADLGLITVHETVSDNSSSSHFLLMERVLSGLRRL